MSKTKKAVITTAALTVVGVAAISAMSYLLYTQLSRLRTGVVKVPTAQGVVHLASTQFWIQLSQILTGKELELSYSPPAQFLKPGLHKYKVPVQSGSMEVYGYYTPYDGRLIVGANTGINPSIPKEPKFNTTAASVLKDYIDFYNKYGQVEERVYVFNMYGQLTAKYHLQPGID